MVMSTNFIRKAVLEDLEDILYLSSMLFAFHAFDHTLNKEWSFSYEARNLFLKRINEGFAIVAIEVVSGDVIAYLTGDKYQAPSFRSLEIIGEIENIFVVEKYRNQRVGTKLVEEFLQWCSNGKANNISVRVRPNNTNALNFYRRIGFKYYTIILERDL